MRRYTGALLAAACAATITGCSSSSTPQAAPAPPSASGNAHSRAVELVRTVIPKASVAEAEEMMRSTCLLVAAHPTPDGVLGLRAELVRNGFGSAVQATTLISAAVAGTCPEHLDALKGI